MRVQRENRWPQREKATEATEGTEEEQKATEGTEEEQMATEGTEGDLRENLGIEFGIGIDRADGSAWHTREKAFVCPPARALNLGLPGSARLGWRLSEKPSGPQRKFSGFGWGGLPQRTQRAQLRVRVGVRVGALVRGRRGVLKRHI